MIRVLAAERFVLPRSIGFPRGLLLLTYTTAYRTLFGFTLEIGRGDLGECESLVRQIKRELKTAKHCAIYEKELSRVWPDDGKPRELQIAQFAEHHGFRLRFYRDGLCAIFDKDLRAVKSNLSETVQHNALAQTRSGL